MYILDDGINEYFEFKMLGHLFLFRYPTMEDMIELRDIAEKNNKAGESLDLSAQDRIFKLISSKEDVDFKDISKKMNIKHWMAFNEMISKELGNNESQGTKNTNEGE